MMSTETKATWRKSPECRCVPSSLQSELWASLTVEGVGSDWLLRVYDLISKDVAGTWGPGMGLAPIRTSSDGRRMLGREVTDKAGDAPEKMAGYTAFSVWCCLLTRDKRVPIPSWSS